VDRALVAGGCGVQPPPKEPGYAVICYHTTGFFYRQLSSKERIAVRRGLLCNSLSHASASASSKVQLQYREKMNKYRY
jgi:hypothetical protein